MPCVFASPAKRALGFSRLRVPFPKHLRAFLVLPPGRERRPPTSQAPPWRASFDDSVGCTPGLHFGSADAAGGGPRFTRTPRYSALCLVFPGDPDHVANAAFRRSRVRWQEPQQVRCLPGIPNCWKSLVKLLRPSVRNTGFLALSCAPAPFQRQGLQLRLPLQPARVRSCRSAQPERDREWPGLSPERAPGQQYPGHAGGLVA